MSSYFAQHLNYSRYSVPMLITVTIDAEILSRVSQS